MVGHTPPTATLHFTQAAPASMENAMASLTFSTAVNGSSLLDSTQSSASRGLARPTHSHPNSSAVNLDPVPGDNDAIFIHAPFTEFPGSSDRKTTLSYADMAAHPNWFLDVNDFIGPNAVGYPPQLEPPRGWCPTKKKDAKDGWKEGEEPRLRCTLCRRQYAGVNAKSMWRRHVYEKHKIAMANRRDTNERPGGRGTRSSNKENSKAAPATTKATEKEQHTRAATKTLRRVVSLEVQASGLAVDDNQNLPLSNGTDNAGEEPAHTQSSGEDENSWVEGPSFSSTPPQTPGMSSDNPVPIFIPPESPYNPLMTPAFRHSPANLLSKQIFKLSPKSGQQLRNCTLTMLARGEASPNVRGLDVSPIVLVPASEREKRSIFSPPRRAPLAVSPRRLFEDAEGDSIQARLDQPGWDAPVTPGNVLRDSDHTSQDFYYEETFGRPEPYSPKGQQFNIHAFFEHARPLRSPSPTYTPNTKMFINGIASPFAGPEYSPMPSLSPGPSTGPRSGRASPSPSPKTSMRRSIKSSTPVFPLLPAFDDGRYSPTLSKPFFSIPDRDMDIDNTPLDFSALESPANPTSSTEWWGGIFDAKSRRQATDNSPGYKGLSGAFSGFGSSGSLSASGSSDSRKNSSPIPSEERSRRGRSSSSAGPSGSGSSSGQKSSIGLMDAILDKKSRRRKHSHSEHRIEGDIGVTATGSPFKVGRKTTRSDSLYSLDGDYEMQEVPPRKRRRTISGRD